MKEGKQDGPPAVVSLAEWKAIIPLVESRKKLLVAGKRDEEKMDQDLGPIQPPPFFLGMRVTVQ